MNPTISVGMVGVGNMGSQILAKLSTQRGEIPFVDSSPTAIDRARAAGGRPVESVSELVKQVDVVLTILPGDTDVVKVATEGLLGEPIVGPRLWIEMSTIDPQTTRKMDERARRAGVSMVDSAIVGRFGDLSFLVGGADADVARACTVLEPIGTVVRCGPVGSGVTAKIVNNMLAGTAFVATCEALTLGLKAGLSLELLLAVLAVTAANNAHLSGSITNKVAARDFQAGFSLALMQKDASLAATLADRLGVPLRLADDVYHLRQAALERGMGALDTTALAQLVEEATGVEIAWTTS